MGTILYMSTGEVIRSAREKKGWSQTLLADYVGTRQETISAYERDLMKPGVEVAIILADLLGLDLRSTFRRRLDKKTA